ncbi:MAG: glycosyltransferase family 2 protein, partial [Candidatus Rokubacteria bacterium]|nr:glycosyltransferase family 2 protein [Candidatus Rokubacteria bacterium]
CDPDFVLALASGQPKLTRHPTFAVVQEPRERFLLDKAAFDGLLTHDGYFTIVDTLHAFLQNVLVGIGREGEIGFCAAAPPRAAIEAAVEGLASTGALRLTYVGEDGDEHPRELLADLDRAALVDVHGPLAAWAHLTGGSYRGALPSDGEALARAYAARGAGLVLLPEGHLRDDVISPRVFEIAAVGAVGVACDTPWLRTHFGDSFYYFDQRAPASRIAERLSDIAREIRQDPPAAAARAREARRIFEQRFSAEVLLENAIAYFQTWRKARSAPDRRLHPAVSAIVRCGGRPLATVRRALQSLRDQTHGRVTAILVLWRDLDVSELQAMTGEALVDVRVVRCGGGGRSATLSAGLQAVDTAYFGIVDDDDCWFPTHLERIFETFRRDPEARLVLSGSIREDRDPFAIAGGGLERRRIDRFGPFGQSTNVWDVLGAFAPNAFIAETALLDPRLTADPRMATAEDSVLELGLIGKSRPRFSYAATAIQYHSDDASRFLEHPQRDEDELALFTRRIRELDAIAGPDATRYLLATRLVRLLAHKGSRIERGDSAPVSAGPTPGVPVPLTAERVELSGRSRLFEGPRGGRGSAPGPRVDVNPAELPWNWGAAVDLGLRGLLGHDAVVIVRGRVEAGSLGITLFDDSERQPLFRRVLAADPGAFELRVPLIKGSRVGKLVAHNWAEGRPCRAVLESVSVLWPDHVRGPEEVRSGPQRALRGLKRGLRRALRAVAAWSRRD